MRNLVLTLFLALAAVSTAGATEKAPADAARAEVVPAVVSSQAPAPESELRLERVRVEERAAQDDAAAAQLGPRGGFWWMVGVIVVAGVILAVVL